MTPKRDAQGRFVKGSGSGGSKAGGRTTDRDLGWKAFAAGVRRNAGTTAVDVGIFVEEVAVYALANEFGTDKIPQRSFIRATVDANRDKYLAMMTKAGLRVGPGLSLADALIPIANELRSDIINAIQAGIPPANAASTVAEKGYDAPLVETGQMQRALTWRVAT